MIPIGTHVDGDRRVSWAVARSPGAARYMPEGYIIVRAPLELGDDGCWYDDDARAYKPVSGMVYSTSLAAATALYRLLATDPTFEADELAPPPFYQTEQDRLFPAGSLPGDQLSLFDAR